MGKKHHWYDAFKHFGKAIVHQVKTTEHAVAHGVPWTFDHIKHAIVTSEHAVGQGVHWTADHVGHAAQTVGHAILTGVPKGLEIFEGGAFGFIPWLVKHIFGGLHIPWWVWLIVFGVLGLFILSFFLR